MSSASGLPTWARDIHLSLPLYPQILLAGNVRDEYLLPSEYDGGASCDLVPIATMLWEVCRARGYQALAQVDAIGILTLLGASGGKLPDFLPQDGDSQEIADLSSFLRRLVRSKTGPVALLFPYASRLAPATVSLTEGQLKFLAFAEELGYQAETVPVHDDTGKANECYNTVFWMCERREDLHPAFPLTSPNLREISVPMPTLDARTSAATLLTQASSTLARTEQLQAAQELAEATQGRTLRDLRLCYRLADDLHLPGHRYRDAARLLSADFHVGCWPQPSGRESAGDDRIATSVTWRNLHTAVKGQPRILW